MRKVILTSVFSVIVFSAVLVLVPGVALAQGNPLRTISLTAGPYVVSINLFEDPLRVDHPLELTVVPHEIGLQLIGQVIVNPILGTDASERSSPLTPDVTDTDLPGTLAATINFPVQGIWQIIVELHGPLGKGTTSFTVKVLAPGPIPLWLAWLIGVSPMAGLVWVARHQCRYKRHLIARKRYWGATLNSTLESRR